MAPCTLHVPTPARMTQPHPGLPTPVILWKTRVTLVIWSQQRAAKCFGLLGAGSVAQSILTPRATTRPHSSSVVPMPAAASTWLYHGNMSATWDRRGVYQGPTSALTSGTHLPTSSSAAGEHTFCCYSFEWGAPVGTRSPTTLYFARPITLHTGQSCQLCCQGMQEESYRCWGHPFPAAPRGCWRSWG